MVVGEKLAITKMKTKVLSRITPSKGINKNENIKECRQKRKKITGGESEGRVKVINQAEKSCETAGEE